MKTKEKVRVELRCIQERAHVADIEIERGEIITAAKVKAGSTRVDFKRYPIVRTIQDGVQMVCANCHAALHFVVAEMVEVSSRGSQFDEVPIRDVPSEWLFDPGDLPKDQGALVGSWVTNKRSSKAAWVIGLVIEHEEKTGKIKVRYRNQPFAAMPGMGRVE